MWSLRLPATHQRAEGHDPILPAVLLLAHRPHSATGLLSIKDSPLAGAAKKCRYSIRRAGDFPRNRSLAAAAGPFVCPPNVRADLRPVVPCSNLGCRLR